MTEDAATDSALPGQCRFHFSAYSNYGRSIYIGTAQVRISHRQPILTWESGSSTGGESANSGRSQGLRMKPRMFSSHIGCDRTKRNESRSLLL
jgi:hypothetical protein